jgi:outer membrane protein assembly factor BamB
MKRIGRSGIFIAAFLMLLVFNPTGCGSKGKQGPAGESGISINWLGSLDTAPSSPTENDAYYNTADGKSYIWDGSAWQVLAENGTDGISINWLGSLSAAPSTSNVNDAYYDTTAGVSYVWDGDSWEILSENGAVGIQGPAGTNGTNGTNGINGTNGTNGTSIRWIGSLASPPGSPALNDAYYNTADKTSYIWGGTSWQILAKDGATGPQGPPGPLGNLSPVINSITIYPQPATVANFLCSSSDPNGDALSYAWKVGGVYPSVITGADWYWYSPGIPGYYRVDVTVSDGNGGTASGNSFINVSSGSPWPKFKRDVQSAGISPYAGPSKSALQWRYQAQSPAGVVFSSPALGDDGTIYFGSENNYVYAINPTGTLKWKYQTGNLIYSSPAVGSDGTVYIGSYDNYLYALNPNGTLKWRYLTNDDIDSSPAVGSDGTIYIGSNDNYLYAINPNGALKWKYLTGNDVLSSMAISADGTIYFGSVDSYLYALNPDGTLKWRYQTGGIVRSTPAIGSDGTAYVGSFNDYIYAINPNGTLKWRYLTGANIYSSPAIGANGTVYVGSADFYLYAISPGGTLKWRYLTSAAVSYSSPAVGADGTIYIGSEDSYLYSLSPNGTLNWRYKTGGVVDSSPAIGADGALYVGSNDGNLYAFNYQNPETMVTMASIPGGCFNMGDAFAEGAADQLPVHNVCLSPFFMSIYETTNSQYMCCVNVGACTAPYSTSSNTRSPYYGNATYDDYPVVFVDWNQAKAYCEWIGGRLPTEAEWEYAARGGLAGKRYPWGDSAPTCTLGATNGENYNSCSPDDTFKVGGFAQNGYGLFDMSGNVWEWVQDWHDAGYYSVSSVYSPTGPSSGTIRVLRGGSWYDDYTQAAWRGNGPLDVPTAHYSHFGFRCAK